MFFGQGERYCAYTLIMTVYQWRVFDVKHGKLATWGRIDQKFHSTRLPIRRNNAYTVIMVVFVISDTVIICLLPVGHQGSETISQSLRM